MLNCRRLAGALDATKGTVVVGGEKDESCLYFSPTIVTDVEEGDQLMQVKERKNRFMCTWCLYCVIYCE